MRIAVRPARLDRSSALVRGWLSWVGANALGELAGLGGTALLLYVVFRQASDGADLVRAGVPASVLIVVLTLLVTGMIVGAIHGYVLLQMLALDRSDRFGMENGSRG